MTRRSAFDEPRSIRTNGIDLSVRIVGHGPAVVLAHGFPDLAKTWRPQAEAIAASGYRAIVPDMRGYGASARPRDIASYDSQTVGADLIGLLDALDEESAVFVGHDWGAASVWPLAVIHPQRVRGVAGLSVPFVPPASRPPTHIMAERFGRSFYMVRFQHAEKPEAELSADVRRTMCAILADRLDAVNGHSDVPAPSWLSEAELDSYVEAFESTGFGGGLNYYRNIDRNWAWAKTWPDASVDVPALFITGTADPVAAFMPSGRMAQRFSQVREERIDGGHWIQQESADQVNGLLLDFLAEVSAA